MGWQVGEHVQVWLADATEVRLRVVAVLADSIDLDRTLLGPIRDHRCQCQPQRRVIAGETLGQVDSLAALYGVTTIVEPGCCVPATPSSSKRRTRSGCPG